MDDLYRAIALGTAALIVAIALLAIVRLQREHRFSGFGTVMSGVGAAVGLGLYILLIDIDLKKEATWGLLAGGALVGAFFGTRIPLYEREGIVVAKAAGWHMALPSAAIATFQVMGVRESVDGIILSFAALHAAAGFAVAACALLLLRRIAVKPTAAAVAPAPTATMPALAASCPSCGALPLPGARFCTRCGGAV